MKAMVLQGLCDLKANRRPLVPVEMPVPAPGPGEVLIRVSACGVCHTELDEIEGRTPPPRFPVIPGHQVIGRVADAGRGAGRFAVGDRVGVAWIFSACGTCDFCRRGKENLCPDFRATGRDADGGYAQYMTAPEGFVHRIPDLFDDAEAAPLLCAGAIGYRSLRLTGLHDGQRLGLTGFGASAHLVLKMVRHRFPRMPVYVFARNSREREFALELGAAWAGDTSDRAPACLDAVIDTTPAWKPVVAALENLRPDGRLIINAVGKEAADKDELLRLDYPRHLWMEKEVKTVANVARRDVAEFLELAARIPIRPQYRTYELADANSALMAIREKGVRGANVLQI